MYSDSAVSTVLLHQMLHGVDLRDDAIDYFEGKSELDVVDDEEN